MAAARDSDDDGPRDISEGAEVSWIEPDDDGYRLDIDATTLPALLERLRQGSAAFRSELSVEVDGPDGPRELTDDELDRLIDDASTQCLAVVERSPVTLDRDDAIELAQGAALLAAIWSLAFQAEEPEGERRERELGWVAVIGRLAADCEEMFVTRISPLPDGAFRLRWSLVDRAVVREAFGEVRSVLSSDDPTVSRLFPTAYGSDEERNAGWDVFMRGELIDRRTGALDIAERIVGRKDCDADELGAFMRCLNDARLVLGTRLDVDEDGFPADATGTPTSDRLLYERLSYLLSLTVDALGQGL